MCLQFQVVYSLIPPAHYYKNPPFTQDTHFTRTVQPSSYLRCPLYDDNFCIFHPSQSNEKLCFLFDVKTLKLNYNKKMVCNY